MNDLRGDLERARAQAPHSSLELGSLQRRHERRAVRRRFGAMMLALAITGSLIVGALAISSARPHLGEGAADGGANEGPGLTPTVDLSLADGEYSFQQVVADYGTFRSWWATDGSGRFEGHPANPYYDGTFGPGGFHSDSGPVAYLSTDPATLYDQLVARVHPNGASPEPYQDWGGDLTWGLVRSIGELLQAPDVSPAQKAALVQVAADLDGMTVVQGVTDPLGRPAVRLSVETEGTRHDWWFDPASLQLLASGDVPPGDPGSASWIVERAGVASALDGSDDLARSFVPPVTAPDLEAQGPSSARNSASASEGP